MGLLVRFGLLAVVLLGIYLLVREDPLWILEIRGNRIRPLKGQVPPDFLHDCQDLLERFPIKSGRLKGLQRGQYTTLGFSMDIPFHARQRFRNLWDLYRR